MLALLIAAPNAWVVPTAPSLPGAATRRLPAAQMLDIPRIALPDTVTSVLADADLKNPNTLDDRAYGTYSAAAIAGTLVLFIPLSFVFGFLPGLVGDLVLSSLLGGGLLAFLALGGAGDDVGGKVNEIGGKVPLGLPKISFPDAIPFSDLSLKNPNSLSDADYATFGASVALGIAVIFLPLSLAFGFLPALIGDFAISALIGGGLCAFLALRKDGIADTVNELGGKLLDAL